MMFAGTSDPLTEISTLPVYANLATADKHLVLFENGTHFTWLWTCAEAPWINNPDGYFFCNEPVWDKDRTHDLANHFTAAFLLAELYGDADAHAALAPNAVQFPGIEYEAVGY